jgi:hypothetical protein
MMCARAYDTGVRIDKHERSPLVSGGHRQGRHGMYARIVTFEGATDIKGAVAEATEGGPPEGLKSSEAYFFADTASGKSMFVTFFETEEDMRAGDAILNAMDPGDIGIGHRTSVDLMDLVSHMTA